MENTTEEFSDYRYILDNLSELALGARYQYGELVDNIDLSYKYRCIIKRFILQEVEPGTTLESHFYCMTRGTVSYEIYQQLHTKVRCYVRKRRKGLLGSSSRYEEAILSVEELADLSPEDKLRRRLLIAEIQIPKMRLMSYAM